MSDERRHGCSTCGSLADEARWGEFWDDRPRHTEPEPPAVRRLAPLNNERWTRHYRCPECAAYFIQHEDGGYAPVEWSNWTLTRVADAPWTQTYECIRRGDFDTLAGQLLSSESAATRKEVAQMLAVQVAEGFDLSPLAPALEAIVDGAGVAAPAAAGLLMRQRLRRGTSVEVEALLTGRPPAVTQAALCAIQEDAYALRRQPSFAAVLGLVRPFLASSDGELLKAAADIVETAGFETKEEGQSTVADAARRLDSPRPAERAAAASILARAAQGARADIRAALPKLRQVAEEAGDDRLLRHEAERALNEASLWLRDSE